MRRLRVAGRGTRERTLGHEDGTAVSKANSRDGTIIAFDRSGTGPSIVLIASALADRSDAKRLARHLSRTFTVINYDRRGRGASSDHTR